MHVLEVAARRYCALCGLDPEETAVMTRFQEEALRRASPGLVVASTGGPTRYDVVVPRWVREASRILRERAMRAALDCLEPPRPAREAALPPEDWT